MKTALLGTLGLLAALSAPVLAHAALYEYVNIEGNLETVTANTALQALTIPTDIAPHSGVMLVTAAAPLTTSTTITTTGADPLPADVVGTYTGTAGGPNNSGEQNLSLELDQSGIATLTTTYQNGQASKLERASWIAIGPNQIQVTIYGTDTEVYTPAEVILLMQNGTTLTASQFESSVFGSGGFTLTK